MQNERLRNLFRRFIAHDIPDDMAACFDCDEDRCSNEQFVTCPDRLARAARETAEPNQG
jgi:hypothetical protein